MRRSTRLQLRQQKSQVRLASVPEGENEDGEVAECNDTEQQSASEEASSDSSSDPIPIPIQLPAPPPLTPFNQGIPVLPPLRLGPLTSTQLYNFCTNLRPPPLRRWRREAWVNCPRGGNRHQGSALPPPPPLVQGGIRPSAPSAALGVVPPIDEEEAGSGREDDETDEEPEELEDSPSEQESQGASQEQDMDTVRSRRQLRARHGGGNVRTQASRSQSSQSSYRPVNVSADNIPLAAVRPTPARALPPLQGPYRPPPSYNAAVAQQQQIAAMKAVAAGGHPLNAAEFTTAYQAGFVQYSPTEQPPLNRVVTVPTNTNGTSNLPPFPVLATGPRSYWPDYQQNVNQAPAQTQSSRVHQVPQQVNNNCSALCAGGGTPCTGRPRTEDNLASRHSLLVQILQSGRPGMNQHPEGMPQSTSAARSAGMPTEDELVEDLLNNN